MSDDIEQQVADLEALSDEVAPEAPGPAQPQAARISLAQAIAPIIINAKPWIKGASVRQVANEIAR